MDELKPSEMYDWCVANLDKSEFDVNRSDLYIKSTPKTDEAIKRLRPTALLHRFIADDGTPWYELPYCAMGIFVGRKHNA